MDCGATTPVFGRYILLIPIPPPTLRRTVITTITIIITMMAVFLGGTVMGEASMAVATVTAAAGSMAVVGAVAGTATESGPGGC